MSVTTSCDERRRVRVATLAGALGWLATPWLPVAAAPAFGSVEHGFLFFPLVATPLALALAAVLLQPRGRTRLLYRAAQHMQPFAGAGVLAAFLVERGSLAAALVVPWMAMAVALAIAGVRAARLGVHPHLSRLNLLVAHVFLPVGTVWLLLSRIGIGPAGLTPLGVLLAALHFHFSGFTLQILVAATAQRVPASTPRLGAVQRCVAVAAIVGIPLIAAGKLLHVEILKSIGVTTIVLATITLAGVSCAVASATRIVLARRLLLVSSGSIAAAMLLAAVFEIGELAGTHWIGIERMATTHGLLNALGFVACGTIAHLRLAAAAPSALG